PGWAGRRRRRGGAAGPTCVRKAQWPARCPRRPRVRSKYASIAWGGDVISPPHALVAPSLLDSPQHSSRPASGVADGLRCNRILARRCRTDRDVHGDSCREVSRRTSSGARSSPEGGLPTLGSNRASPTWATDADRRGRRRRRRGATAAPAAPTRQLRRAPPRPPPVLTTR